MVKNLEGKEKFNPHVRKIYGLEETTGSANTRFMESKECRLFLLTS